MVIASNDDEENLMNVQSHTKTEYKECRKNHAFKIGCYAIDGCCEFLPAGTEGTVEFFKCAACGCHRNFHRKETIVVTVEQALSPLNINRFPQPTPISTVFQTSTGYVHVNGPPRGAIIYPALPSAVVHGREHLSREKIEDNVCVVESINGDGEGSSNSKKRFRTKFTHEQRKKMFDFAVKSGWKIPKKDENLVEEFCNEIGVKCQILKVWMNNNKYTLGERH
ncbi:zinc-finger homeodomain protein 2 [Lathyrus oleraceus]|uniref:ZF-HD dimerization-type domain-containing protein n=1 Tax=Pisum sativum TaxID=3888 RepID=A0A9D4XF76_PEA|nr:zinc-finger homeodomain protein 2-like [Pisum sativum]KAI5419268.1 hypothetical protein KIW84_043440 [Pisum sativum]